MSGANYEWCPVCDQKALYVGDQDVPDGVVVLHEACRQREVAQATTAERERVRAQLLDVVTSHAASGNDWLLSELLTAIRELGGAADGAHTPGGAT